jgi:hypothetical protein
VQGEGEKARERTAGRRGTAGERESDRGRENKRRKNCTNERQIERKRGSKCER